MEELKKVGYKCISTDENGNPAAIWYGSIKQGNYGPFISVEKRWVSECTKSGKIVRTKYAGKSFNFPINATKGKAMIEAIYALVNKALTVAAEFSNAEEETELEADNW